MATTTIPWDDGSGDNIYLTYPSASGDQTVEVSSDANTGSARTQTVTFTAGSVVQILTVNQDGGPRQYTLTKYPSSYVAADSSFSGSIQNPSNAYTSATSTSNARITMNTGANAQSWIYYKFDCSSIPANATIDSVSCSVKTAVSSGTGNIPTANVGLCTGTTLKGSTGTATGTTARTNTLSGADWTRAELDDIRVRFYAKRATGNPSIALYMRFYGATLTVTYTV